LPASEHRPGRPPFLRVATPERICELTLPDFDLDQVILEVYWTSALELLHIAQRRQDQQTARVRVVELQSGEMLHQLEVPAAALRSSPPSVPRAADPLLDGSQ